MGDSIRWSPNMVHVTAARMLLSALLICLVTTALAQTTPATTNNAASIADGNVTPKSGPALTGERRPLYRLQKSDVLDIKFTFSPEYDQTVTVQPDGFIALKAADSIVAEGLTLASLRESVTKAYRPILLDPEVSIVLRDYEKPHFVAGGQVGRPGKYELRAATSASEAIAIAGGFTDASKHSQVVLFRKVADGVVESHVLNLKGMLASRDLEEDPQLEPGDMLFVPQNRISKIKKFLPVASLSTFLTPAQF